MICICIINYIPLRMNFKTIDLPIFKIIDTKNKMMQKKKEKTNRHCANI